MRRHMLPLVLTLAGLAFLVGPPLVYLVHLGDFGRLPARDYYGVPATTARRWICPRRTSFVSSRTSTP